MKKQLFLLLYLTALAFGYKDIDADEATLFMNSQDAVVIDVRLNEEWIETGVIANAYLITYFDAQARALKTEFLKKLSGVTKQNKTKPIILVCRTGLRSKLVAGVLDREGYKNVYNYKDGMVGWISERRSVVAPKK